MEGTILATHAKAEHVTQTQKDDGPDQNPGASRSDPRHAALPNQHVHLFHS